MLITLLRTDSPPPDSSSRSSSAGSGPAAGLGAGAGAGPQQRIVSGSLKDRIAKFNNPSAAPLVPTHPFGTSGPPTSSASHIRGGLIGNRLPTLDPRTAGVIGGFRRTSENRGMIGKRIPSASGRSGAGRSASPTGSVDSSIASAAAGTSTSPGTSRSSSPPTSPGGGLPPSLLAATLPDQGGPGAMTPSSTMAEAGESTTDLSVPSTPVAAPTDLPPGQYDLVPGNLNLASTAEMTRGLSSGSGPRFFAPSVSSSLVSQYDPSSKDAEEKQMMDDVSGISTPMGTPRAANRELGEGDSVRDDRSMRDDRSVPSGSVRGDGSVAGDIEAEREVAEITGGVGGLAVDEKPIDRDPTPEPPKEVVPQEEEFTKTPGLTSSATLEHGDEDHGHSDKAEAAAEAAGPVPGEDLNTAKDLDALKTGELEHPAPARTQDDNPVNLLAETGFTQNLDEKVVPPAEQKEQGGPAGGRIDEFETADAVVPPKTKSEAYAAGEDLEVREATPQGGANAEGEGRSEVLEGQEGSAKAGLLDKGEAESKESISAQEESIYEAPEGKQAPAAGSEQPSDTAAAAAAAPTDAQLDGSGTNDTAVISAMQQREDEAHAPSEPHDDANVLESAAESVSAIDAADVPPSSKVDAGDPSEPKATPKGDSALVTETRPEGAPQPFKEVASPHKPIQVHVEPAPIRQPVSATADEAAHPAPTEIPEAASVEPENGNATAADADADADAEPLSDIAGHQHTPADFPEPPHNELEPSSAETPDLNAASATSTPVDPTFLKAFPTVPDEEHPRVQVHISPHNTPIKHRQSFTSPTDVGAVQIKSEEPVLPDVPSTPLAQAPLQGSTSSAGEDGSHTHAATGPETPARGSGAADQTGTPTETSTWTETPETVKPLHKRGSTSTSTRMSPKSPLLDDEDSGDFEAGWAVVTKGRDS
ncbi:hypothetical protein JCM24511_04037 [Saitozyma sp. JCM 24511]|nr:hypothetical protein JCM24511_04037 [Saitozyma sp. JCM 24511]